MIISTLDRLHYVPAMKALELSYHILLEKPMSPVAEECIRIEQAALAHRRVLTVSHVLRYSPFWSGIKRCIEAGEVGTIATIQHSEYVGYRHMTHNYVRGNWRNSDQSSPMVLAKSCHDLDIISWLMDEPCVSVSSYGSLLHFREEHAPQAPRPGARTAARRNAAAPSRRSSCTTSRRSTRGRATLRMICHRKAL